MLVHQFRKGEFMYTIKDTSWGLRLTFGGSLEVEEVAQWLEDLRKILAAQMGPFSSFVDMRTLIPLGKEAMASLGEGQELARNCGMIRSVVIVQNPATASQFRRIAGDTGIHQWERYIDASTVADWEERGMDWILQGIEPTSEREAVRPV